MNWELIKELDYFDIHSNLGLCFDGIDIRQEIIKTHMEV